MIDVSGEQSHKAGVFLVGAEPSNLALSTDGKLVNGIAQTVDYVTKLETHRAKGMAPRRPDPVQ